MISLVVVVSIHFTTKKLSRLPCDGSSNVVALVGRHVRVHTVYTGYSGPDIVYNYHKIFIFLLF